MKSFEREYSPTQAKKLKYPENFAREDGEFGEMTNYIHFRSLPRRATGEHDGEEELYKFLKSNQDNIDIRMVGDDHKGHPFTGDDLNINIIFNSRDHDYSTTNTIKEIIKKRGNK